MRQLQLKFELKLSLCRSLSSTSEDANSSFQHQKHSQYLFFDICLISDVINPVHLLWTKELQVLQGIPLRGLTSVLEQTKQDVLYLFISELEDDSFLLTNKRCSFSSVQLENGKSRQGLQSQTFFWRCISAYFGIHFSIFFSINHRCHNKCCQHYQVYALHILNMNNQYNRYN